MFQRPKVAKAPLFRVFRAFHVFLTLQKVCKYQHYPPKHAVIHSVFLFRLQKALVFAVFCASLVKKSIGISAFSTICIVPAKDVKTQKCCNL